MKGLQDPRRISDNAGSDSNVFLIEYKLRTFEGIKNPFADGEGPKYGNVGLRFTIGNRQLPGNYEDGWSYVNDDWLFDPAYLYIEAEDILKKNKKFKIPFTTTHSLSLLVEPEGEYVTIKVDKEGIDDFRERFGDFQPVKVKRIHAAYQFLKAYNSILRDLYRYRETDALLEFFKPQWRELFKNKDVRTAFENENVKIFELDDNALDISTYSKEIKSFLEKLKENGLRGLNNTERLFFEHIIIPRVAEEYGLSLKEAKRKILDGELDVSLVLI